MFAFLGVKMVFGETNCASGVGGMLVKGGVGIGEGGRMSVIGGGEGRNSMGLGESKLI